MEGKKKLFTSRKVDNSGIKKFDGKFKVAKKETLKKDRLERLIQVTLIV